MGGSPTQPYYADISQALKTDRLDLVDWGFVPILANICGPTLETNEGLLAKLCSVGAISHSLCQQLMGAGGFRNVLVHEYLEIDLNEVADALTKEPQIFRSFGTEVLSWLNQKQRGD